MSADKSGLIPASGGCVFAATGFNAILGWYLFMGFKGYRE